MKAKESWQGIRRLMEEKRDADADHFLATLNSRLEASLNIHSILFCHLVVLFMSRSFFCFCVTLL